jgi:nicotinate dehydrogenase subunit A
MPTETKALRLTVNGVARDVEVQDMTALLSVLRHDFALKATRMGCGDGNCGACTVLVDGHAVQSCNTPLWSVVGKSVETLEAAAHHALIARVQAAFLAEQAAQCGYCTNGIMMSVVAALAQPVAPTRQSIIARLDEHHLCRCGAHPRILRAVDRLLSDTAGVPA